MHWYSHGNFMTSGLPGTATTVNNYVSDEKGIWYIWSIDREREREK